MQQLISNRFYSRAVLSLSQYLRYAATALAAMIVTVLSREIIQFLFTDDNKTVYGLSIIIAYAVGIMVNFSLQKRFTFQVERDHNNAELFLGFTIVALVGATVSLVMAFVLRYGLNLDKLAGSRASTIAFFGATVLSSFLTYALNARYIFSGRHHLP